MPETVWILGIHMTRFGKHPDKDAMDLATEAVRGALVDGGLTMFDVGVIAAGNNLGAGYPTGQLIQKQLGQAGVPVYNVFNACATGATALRTVINSIRAEEADIGLAVGVEKMSGFGLITPDKLDAAKATGSGSKVFEPAGRDGAVDDLEGRVGTLNMAGYFGQVGLDYGARHGGTSFELFARIAEKNHAHSVLNPLAAYQKRMTLDEVMNDVMVAYPHTRSMCSANCDGAAAAVIVSDRKLATLDPDQRRRAVKVSASVLTSDPWREGCQVFFDIDTLTRDAAAKAYEEAGLGPDDLDLVELHDCFAAAELVHYDNLGLCAEGGAVDFFESGAPWRDGRLPVSVSGGLQSKGHPLAATGIANVWEIATHLRGEAGARQIDGARVGLAHVLGLGSACGVHILERRTA